MNGPTMRARAEGKARCTSKSPRSTVRGTMICSIASLARASPSAGSLPGKKLMAPFLAPKLSACQSRPLRQRFELGPCDHRMHAAAEAAIGRGDHPFPADALGETQNTLGDEFGMLHHVGGMADHAGKNDFAVGKLDVLPNRPFVLVAHIAGLERVALAFDRQHDLDDVTHRNIGGVRT